MRPESKSARSYLQVDKIMKTVEKWLAIRMKSSCGLEKTAISSRMSQLIVSQLREPFLRMNIGGHIDEKIKLPRKLYCGKMVINIETGSVKPSVKLLIPSIMKFIALWLLSFAYIFRSLVMNKSESGPVTLIYGVPYANLTMDGSAQLFEDFCQKGSLDVLSSAKKFIVQTGLPVKAGNSKSFVYARFPLFALFLANKLNMNDSLVFMKQHVSIFFRYIYMMLKCPITCLLWRDFAVHAMVIALNNKKLIKANIITNSNWLEQFLWMTDLSNRHFKTYMVLYSQNTSSMIFKDDPVKAVYPGIKNLRVDLIFIWDAFYEEVLKQQGVFIKTRVVTPVLWYLPIIKTAQKNTKLLKICVFDVSPMSKDYLLDQGMTGSYYNTENMLSYMNDILVVVDNLKKQLKCEIEVILKHKRAPKKAAQDVSYFSHVKELCESNTNLRLVGENTNLFTLIADCELVIVVPFSSPVYVANYLNIPALFYDPTNKILVSNEIVSPIIFVSGRENLTIEIANILERKVDLV